MREVVVVRIINRHIRLLVAVADVTPSVGDVVVEVDIAYRLRRYLTIDQQPLNVTLPEHMKALQAIETTRETFVVGHERRSYGQWAVSGYRFRKNLNHTVI